MLQKNPVKRHSASECLNHDWFKKDQQEIPIDMTSYFENLKKFEIKSKMQQAIYSFFIQHIIKQDEIEELIKTFK
jgi:hypothetical protein